MRGKRGQLIQWEEILVLLNTTQGFKNEKWTKCASFLYFQEYRVWSITTPSAQVSCRILTLLKLDSEPRTTGQGRREVWRGLVWWDDYNFLFWNLVGLCSFRELSRELYLQRQVAGDRFPGGLLREKFCSYYNICHIRLASCAEL